MEYIIQTQNLTKKYKNDTVVNNLNLKIKEGEIYGLLGQNGAGKTTTMCLLTNLSEKTSGQIRIFGKNPQENIDIYKKIGVIIETPGFYPDILILDEPINGLDPLGIQEIRQYLKKLATKNNTTIIISSHILSEIEQLVDTIGIIHHGQLLEQISMNTFREKTKKYIQIEVSDTYKASYILKKAFKIIPEINKNQIIIRILLLVMMIKIESTFTYSLLFEQSLEYVTLLFGFLLYILLATYIFNREYTEHTLKTVITTPLSRTKFIISKLVVIFIWMSILTLIFYLSTIFVGYIGGATQLTTQSLMIFLKELYIADVLLFLLITPFIFITMLLKNIIPSIICGVAMVLANVMSIGDKISVYNPGTAVYLLSTYQPYINSLIYNQSPLIPFTVIILISIIGFILSWLYFTKTDITL